MEDDNDGDELPSDTNISQYSKIFLNIVDFVGGNELFAHLWTENDKFRLNTFGSLSEEAQQVYVRLLMRKKQWLLKLKLKYPKISPDLSPFLDELVTRNFLLSASALNSYGDVLDILQLTSLKALAKQFRINAAISKKDDLKQALKALPSKQRSLFGNSLEKSLLKSAKQELGECFRVENETRTLFVGMLVLYAPSEMDSSQLLDQPSLNLAQQLVYTKLQAERGELIFPGPSTSTLTRKGVLFLNRQQLNHYVGSMDAEHDVAVRILHQRHSDIIPISDAAKLRISAISEDDFLHYKQLPEYLRKYTGPWVDTRLVWLGVEALQKLKRYEEAVQWLRWLLRDTIWCPESRGKWFERLALNLEVHLKKRSEAIEVIESAFADERVSLPSKVSLRERLQRLQPPSIEDVAPKRNRKRKAAHLSYNESSLKQLKQIPQKRIEGQLLGKMLGGGVKTVFTSNTRGDGATQICSVEAVALSHYLEVEGFSQGLHSEGEVWHALFALLCWDEIYADSIENVWWSPIQTAPLDLNSNVFFQNRSAAFKKRFAWLKAANVATLVDEVRESWTKNFGKSSFLVSWEKFECADRLQEIASCLGGQKLAVIFEHLTMDFRHRRSGFPDLVVWNAGSFEIKLAEVKGPGDRASTKQRLWLDFFCSAGVQAEICHVEGKV